MTFLITADVHMNEKPLDADRWNLWPWLRTQAKKTGAKHLLILGDLTEFKDKHTSRLVNRLTNEIAALSQLLQVIVLKGNHDYVDEDSPFFEFFNHIGQSVYFITKPTEIELDDGVNGARNRKRCLFLPCTRNYEEDWANLEKDFEMPKLKYIFCHQTFDGALAENGMPLPGVSPTRFKDVRSSAKIFSGDIHVPQKISSHIEYVGSPFRVHFGDKFTPRCLLLRKGEAIDLHFPAKGRESITVRTVEDVAKHDFVMGTQVKVVVRLKRSEYPNWPGIRKDIRKLMADKGWENCGIDSKKIKTKDRELDEGEKITDQVNHEGVVHAHSKAKKLNKELRNLGLELIREAQQ